MTDSRKYREPEEQAAEDKKNNDKIKIKLNLFSSLMTNSATGDQAQPNW